MTWRKCKFLAQIVDTGSSLRKSGRMMFEQLSRVSNRNFRTVWFGLVHQGDKLEVSHATSSARYQDTTRARKTSLLLLENLYGKTS